MILKYVASRIAPERRRPSLSFAHHRLVAPLEPAEQTKFLDLAERNGLDRDEFDVVVRNFKKNIDAPVAESPDSDSGDNIDGGSDGDSNSEDNGSTDSAGFDCANGPHSLMIAITEDAIDYLEGKFKNLKRSEIGQVLKGVVDHFQEKYGRGFDLLKVERVA